MNTGKDQKIASVHAHEMASYMCHFFLYKMI